jgi:hypothetical protein
MRNGASDTCSSECIIVFEVCYRGVLNSSYRSASLRFPYVALAALLLQTMLRHQSASVQRAVNRQTNEAALRYDDVAAGKQTALPVRRPLPWKRS